MKNAVEKAIELVSRRIHSKKELIFKLQRKFPKNDVDQAILRLEELGYIDENRASEVFLRSLLLKGKSNAEIKIKFNEKGLKPPPLPDEEERIEQRKKNKPKEYFLRKGFKFEAVKKVFKN